jgi:hypothetical protein
MKNLLPCALLAFGTPGWANPSVIETVNAAESGGTWRFDVTVSHPDTGWDHYTNGWRVLTMDGKELGMRVLHHPHTDEQPFTRSLSGVLIPPGTKQVKIQARCIVDGWDGATKTVKLP